MATAPTRVGRYSPSTGNYSTSTSPKVTTETFDIVVGERFWCQAQVENAGNQSVVTPTVSGGAIAWTLVARVPDSSSVNQSALWGWTGICTTAATGVTVTLAAPFSAGSVVWGFSVTHVRDSSGVGAIWDDSNTTGSGAPSSAQTVQANSLVIFNVNDWNAIDGATRAFRMSATESNYYSNPGNTHSVYGAYVLDTTAGTFTAGLTTPSTMRWGLIGVEFLGAAPSAIDGYILLENGDRILSESGSDLIVSEDFVGSGDTAGTLSASLPRITAALTGTVTGPIYAGTLASTLPKLTGSLTGVAAGPTYSGTLAGATPKVTGAIAGSAAAPIYAGTLSAPTPKLAGTIAGTTSAPTYSGTLVASVPALAADVPGVATPPPTSGTISAATPAVTGALTGTVTAPTYSGALVGATPRPVASITGSAVSPSYSGTLTAAIPPTRATITGTATNPAGTGTLSGTTPKVAGAVSGAFTAPVWAGILNGQLARLTAAVTGVAAAPSYAGSIAGSTPPVTASVAGAVTPPTFAGELDATLAVISGVITGVAQAGPAGPRPELSVGPALTATYSVGPRIPGPGLPGAGEPSITVAPAAPPRYSVGERL